VGAASSLVYKHQPYPQQKPGQLVAYLQAQSSGASHQQAGAADQGGCAPSPPCSHMITQHMNTLLMIIQPTCCCWGPVPSQLPRFVSSRWTTQCTLFRPQAGLSKACPSDQPNSDTSFAHRQDLLAVRRIGCTLHETYALHQSWGNTPFDLELLQALLLLRIPPVTQVQEAWQDQGGVPGGVSNTRSGHSS
jgi:hypothetical protein